jgi:hypothetical protein
VEFTEHSSGDTPAERLLENVLGGVAEFEWEEIRRRTMAGRLQKAREKKVMANGVAPFGFRCISTAEAVVSPEYHGRSGEYLVVPEKAEIVRGMFERCAQGQSLRSIAEWVRAQTGSGDKGISRSYIQTMLRNPAYAGRPEYRRQHTRTIGGKVKRSVRPLEERIQLQCPAIVSEELFAAVQARLDANRENLKGRPTRIWLLKGCVECGVCIAKGQPRRCTGAGGHERNGTKRYYRCNSRIDGKDVWCGAQFLADDLEELARLALLEAAKPGRLAEMERQRADAASKSRGNPDRAIADLGRALAALDAEEDRTLEAALSGFSATAIEKRVLSIKERRSKLQSSLADLRGQAAMISDPRDAASRGEVAAVRLREALNDPDQFTNLARLFLTIRLFPDRRPEITVRVPPAFGLP